MYKRSINTVAEADTNHLLIGGLGARSRSYKVSKSATI